MKDGTGAPLKTPLQVRKMQNSTKTHETLGGHRDSRGGHNDIYEGQNSNFFALGRTSSHGFRVRPGMENVRPRTANMELFCAYRLVMEKCIFSCIVPDRLRPKYARVARLAREMR